MAKNVDIESPGSPLAVILGVHRAQAARANRRTRGSACEPLQLRAGSVGAQLRGVPAGRLPFGLSFSSALAAWAASLRGVGRSEGTRETGRRPSSSPAASPMVWATGIGAAPPAGPWRPLEPREARSSEARGDERPAVIRAALGARVESIWAAPSPLRVEAGANLAGTPSVTPQSTPPAASASESRAAPDAYDEGAPLPEAESAHVALARLLPAWSLLSLLGAFPRGPTLPSSASDRALPMLALGPRVAPSGARPGAAVAGHSGFVHATAWAALPTRPASTIGRNGETSSPGDAFDVAPAPEPTWRAIGDGAAAASPELAPRLVERTAAAGVAPLAGLPALPGLAAPLRSLVAKEIAREVTRQTSRPVERSAAPPPAPPPIDVSSDDFVRRLAARMRALAHQERFRGGLLR